MGITESYDFSRLQRQERNFIIVYTTLKLLLPLGGGGARL